MCTTVSIILAFLLTLGGSPVQIGGNACPVNPVHSISTLSPYNVPGTPESTPEESSNAIPASTIGNTILFQGRQYDPETNLYYFRARHYDPTMGRFLQTDPLGYHDSMNLYQAFNMNPVNFVDPMGLSHVEPSLLPCYLAAKKDNPAIASMYERVSVAAMMSLGGGFIAKVAGVKATISALLSLNITSTLDDAVARKKAGQSNEEINRAATAKLLLFDSPYKIITGKDYGTQKKVSLADRVATTGEAVVSTIGFAAGYNSVRMNPSTFQLMDEAFGVLDFRKTSTGYVAVTTESNITTAKSGTYQYDMMNPGPLPDKVAGTFRGGRYSEGTIQPGQILYRGGDAASPEGSYFTFTPPESIADVRINSAVKPQWFDENGVLTGVSNVNSSIEVTIPVGTMYYYGPTGSQGGIYIGGNIQIFIPNARRIGEFKVIGVLK